MSSTKCQSSNQSVSDNCHYNYNIISDVCTCVFDAHKMLTIKLRN